MTKDENSKRKEWKEYEGIHPDRMGKFSYDKPGELEISLPQCSDCKLNVGAFKCEVYGVKPKVYQYNEKSCPGYERNG